MNNSRILRCGKMLPPQLNLVIEIEFADATTALCSKNAGAHPAGATLSTDFEIQNVRVLASQVVLDSALVESFNRVLLSGRSLVFSYPTVHTQQSTLPPGVAEHNVTVRAFKDPPAGQPGAGRGPHQSGQAGRQSPGVADAAGQPAVPAQPYEGSIGALPLPLAPCGDHDDTVRNIDIDRAGHLRHSFIAAFPTERVPKMTLSGVSTRSGDLARFTFKALDGTMQ